MDTPKDFLLDSNWLVTLSSILITIYIFVLGVPILLQQTFLPEKLREIANKHFFFKKQIDGLKVISILIILFIFFLGNPAWKYLYYSEINDNYLLSTLITVHLIGLLFFLYINLKVYSFINKYILQMPIPKISFTKPKFNDPKSWTWIRIKSTLPQSKHTIYLEILDSIKNDIIFRCVNCEDKISISSYVEELTQLSHVCEDNINRAKYLSAIYEISDSILKDKGYKGDSLQHLIRDVLTDEINRNFEDYSIENIKQLIAIAKLLIDRNDEYILKDTELNDFDRNEIKSMLTILAKYILDSMDSIGFEKLFEESFKILKRVDQSYFNCFLLQKLMYERKEYASLKKEFISLKSDLNCYDGYYYFYFIAYLSWLSSAESASIKDFGKEQLGELKSKDTAISNAINKAKEFFSNRNQFETTDLIVLLTQEL